MLLAIRFLDHKQRLTCRQVSKTWCKTISFSSFFLLELLDSESYDYASSIAKNLPLINKFDFKMWRVKFRSWCKEGKIWPIYWILNKNILTFFQIAFLAEEGFKIALYNQHLDICIALKAYIIDFRRLQFQIIPEINILTPYASKWLLTFPTEILCCGGNIESLQVLITSYDFSSQEIIDAALHYAANDKPQTSLWKCVLLLRGFINDEYYIHRLNCLICKKAPLHVIQSLTLNPEKRDSYLLEATNFEVKNWLRSLGTSPLDF